MDNWLSSIFCVHHWVFLGHWDWSNLPHNPVGLIGAVVGSRNHLWGLKTTTIYQFWRSGTPHLHTTTVPWRSEKLHPNREIQSFPRRFDPFGSSPVALSCRQLFLSQLQQTEGARTNQSRKDEEESIRIFTGSGSLSQPIEVTSWHEKSSSLS